MSDDVNLRKFVVDALRPLLPRRWKWFDYSTGLDELTAVTVVLTLKSVTRTPAAPMGSRTVEYTLTIIDPSGNPAQREDSLDDHLIDLLTAIDKTKNISWTGAERGLDSSAKHLGYDITLTIPITNTQGA